MSENDPTNQAAWSDDMLWVSNAFGSAMILIDRSGALHANAAAQALAERALSHRRSRSAIDEAMPAPGQVSDHVAADPAILLRLLPPQAWEIAQAEGAGSARPPCRARR